MKSWEVVVVSWDQTKCSCIDEVALTNVERKMHVYVDGWEDIQVYRSRCRNSQKHEAITASKSDKLCAVKPLDRHEAFESTIFHLFQRRRRSREWNPKEKAHNKPHEIIIKRSKRAINAFWWHIMIDSICRRNLFPAGSWPLDQPYIIHIKLDSCAS